MIASGRLAAKMLVRQAYVIGGYWRQHMIALILLTSALRSGRSREWDCPYNSVLDTPADAEKRDLSRRPDTEISHGWLTQRLLKESADRVAIRGSLQLPSKLVVH